MNPPKIFRFDNRFVWHGADNLLFLEKCLPIRQCPEDCPLKTDSSAQYLQWILLSSQITAIILLCNVQKTNLPSIELDHRQFSIQETKISFNTHKIINKLSSFYQSEIIALKKNVHRIKHVIIYTIAITVIGSIYNLIKLYNISLKSY